MGDTNDQIARSKEYTVYGVDELSAQASKT